MFDYLIRKRPARFGRCVLHIGTEKTGTSTIQRFLASNRGALAADGVLYPSCGGGENGGSQWGFAAVAARKAWTLDVGRFLDIRLAEQAQRYRETLADELSRACERTRRRETLVVSSEHLHSRLRQVDEIVALKDFMARWADTFQVVLYLRRQDRVAVSQYSTKVKSGAVNPVMFPPVKPGALPYYFDLEAIHRQWAQVFSADAITVRLFDQAELVGGDLIRDFAQATGIACEGKQVPAPRNQSLSDEGLDFLLAVNRLLAQTTDGNDDALRRDFARRIGQLCAGRPQRVARAQAQAFCQRFRESNERLRATAFPLRDRPLFDDCFDEYAEQPSPSEPTFDDAVRLAVRLLEPGEGSQFSRVTAALRHELLPKARGGGVD